MNRINTNKSYRNNKLKNKFLNKKIIFTRKRSLKISEDLLGKVFYIYNGKNFFSKVKITDYLIGYKLGELSSTRIAHIYKKKKGKKIVKKKK